MIAIGGNITATVQSKSGSAVNAIGEHIESWNTVGTVLGWLDFQSGQNDIQQYKGKIQDTTHIFLCDASKWASATQGACTAENSRLVISGHIYNILLIDNPMELNQHMEVYLQYVGSGL